MSETDHKVMSFFRNTMCISAIKMDINTLILLPFAKIEYRNSMNNMKHHVKV